MQAYKCMDVQGAHQSVATNYTLWLVQNGNFGISEIHSSIHKSVRRLKPVVLTGLEFKIMYSHSQM